MSEPITPGGGLGGPVSRPDGNGLPPSPGIPSPGLGSGDSRDPGTEGDGDLGQDTGGATPGGLVGEA